MTFNIETEPPMTADPRPVIDMADLLALSQSGDHPGWRVLDTARRDGFTGEIHFSSAPAISAYFDDGHVYHAVRDGDPSLCQLLLEADVVSAAQIERGVVNVGTVEHLGRLFDRDHTVDRDSVMVVAEMHTDELVTQLAARPAEFITVTAYRHHASGIHRWFVAPIDRNQLSPVGAVAQIDASVTSDLPTLGTLDDAADLRIEWEEPTIGAPLDAETLLSFDDTGLVEVTDAVSFDDPAAHVEPQSSPLSGLDDFVVHSRAGDDAYDADPQPSTRDFQIVWPNGSEQPVADTPVDTSTDQAESDPLGDNAASAAERVIAAATQPAPFDPFPDLPDFAFSTPALTLDDVVEDSAPNTDAHAPAEVADFDPPVDIASAPDLGAGIDEVSAETPVPDLSLPDFEPLPDVTPLPELSLDDAAPAASIEPLAVEPDPAPPAPAPPLAHPVPGSDPLSGFVDPAWGVAVPEVPAVAETAVPETGVAEVPTIAVAAIATEAAAPVEDHAAADFGAAAPADTARAATASADTGATTSMIGDPLFGLSRDTAVAPESSPAPAESLFAESAPIEHAPDPSDEVVDAVRRALHAIEFAAPATDIDETLSPSSAEVAPSGPSAASLATPEVHPNAFAPPTSEQSVEAIYSRAATAAEDTPAPGVASVVFVEDESEAAEDDRAGALRRLIGSLRRK